MFSRLQPRSRLSGHGQVHWILCATLVAVAGCASSSQQRDEMARLRRAAARHHLEAPRDSRAVAIDGSLDRYVAHAMHHNPALEQSFEAWRAHIYSIARARRLPEPTVSYALYVRRIETRVGPQRHRFGVRQMLPWPGKLAAAADAAAARARAAGVRFDAQALAIRRGVADAYWSVWQIGEIARIQDEQRVVLEQLAAVVRARMETGRASLADVGQLDLTVSRIADTVAGQQAALALAQADLREAIGAPAGLALPIATVAPRVALPAAEIRSLRDAARAHPRVTQHIALAEASDRDRARARAAGRPDLAVGVDWVETGPAAAPGVADSGKDAVMVSVSMTLPVWRRSYADEARKAAAEAASLRARARSAELSADAALDRILARIRDTARRVELYQTTHIPQADTVYRAVVGAYQAGSSSLADALMAHTNLLELRVQLARARAEHARAWAALDDLVGYEVPRKEAP